MGKIRLLAMAAGVMLLGLALGLYGIVRASLPDNDGRLSLPGLSAPAEVTLDERGIPRISARTREDAFHALGFVTARDRLFQMDLLRRHAAGRLAEVLGAGLAESDRRHRIMGFESLAQEVLARLPEDQKAVLRAYAEGVNQAVDLMPVRPPEFLLLGYRPAVWCPEDSLLVVLGMEENLSWPSDLERMLTVMKASLPSSVYAFLTPPMDHYTNRILNGDSSQYKPRAIPKNELAAILENVDDNERHIALLEDVAVPGGSNAFVVGPTKTHDGRAILANDMHLALTVPNIWYRAELHYANSNLSGFTLPGVPLLISGSNGHISWGFTSISGDLSDLVLLDIDPADRERYYTAKGFTRFGKRKETIKIRGKPDLTVEIRTTIWGPVLPDSLVGRLVALRWTALDPAATDLKFLDLDSVSDVNEALTLFNQAGGPPLNALVVDVLGNIGWTYSGKIPKRFGLNGSVAQSWANGIRGWRGYIAPQELPRIINPTSGFIVNANQRMVGEQTLPYAIGNNFGGGYRAYRISQLLEGMEDLTENDLLKVQLDSRTDFFRYYQQLALSLLKKDSNPAEQRLKRNLASWDGYAEPESSGLTILIEFRRLLLDTVIGPYLVGCRRMEPAFRFDWLVLDEPLQQILEAELPELLPDKKTYQSWDAFLHELLILSERNVLDYYKANSPESVTWGMANTASIAHPFSSSFPLFQYLLNMPAEPLAGCIECVRWNAKGGGASERLVVSPNHEVEGILHMPTGQSGHLLSPHYRDQHIAWVEGQSLPFLTGLPRHRLEFVPTESGESQ